MGIIELEEFDTVQLPESSDSKFPSMRRSVFIACDKSGKRCSGSSGRSELASSFNLILHPIFRPSFSATVVLKFAISEKCKSCSSSNSQFLIN